MKRSFSRVFVPVLAAVLVPCSAAWAQQNRVEAPLTLAQAQQKPNVPPEVQQVEEAVEETVERFRIGVQGGVGLDPELIVFGAHGAFAPIFHRNVEFRPGIDFGVGEVTTSFGVNLDVIYLFPGTTAQTRWRPYIGGGPNFGLSHQDFDPQGDDDDLIDDDDDRNRFDFSDTDFEAGFNFIAGARMRNGMFVELKATAYGVTNVRMLIGFNF